MDGASIYDDWSGPKRLRRRIMSSVYRFPDTGLFGLKPLKTHVLICGFPASGTTLFQLMLENGLPQARRFGKEVGGWRAATYAWRNHPIVISKVPHDLFRLEPLRAFYARRPANLRVILTLRDPRDLMTARRPPGGRHGDPDAAAEYCLTPQQWRRYWVGFLHQRDRADALVLRYEDLVADVAGQQARIESFVDERMAVPFADFLSVDRPDFDTTTLRGLRAVDPSRVARWMDPVHGSRIRSLLSDLPELPEALVRLGYEPDAQWTRRFGDAACRNELTTVR